MERKKIFGLGALVLGAAAISGCSVLEQAVDSRFEYKATLETNGAFVDCYTDVNPSAKTVRGKTTVIFDLAFCFNQTPRAREIIGMPLSEPFSGKVTVDNIGVIEKPLVATPQP